MPLPYRQVLERYDRARAFGETKTLPEYATHLNNIYQTDQFSEGLRDGPWTRFSTRADQFIQNSPVGETFAGLGEAAGGVFGQAEAGRRVGEGLPRALLQTAPLYLLGPEAGVPATVLALGATGAAFGGQTYADTGSVKAAALSGGTAAAMPILGKYGGQFGAQVFGAPRIAGESVAQAGKFINEVIPTTTAQRVAQFGGSQLAQSVAQEASGYAQHKTLDPETPYDWLSPDFLIGQIPFTVMDAYHMTKAPKITPDQARGLVKESVLVKPKTVEPYQRRDVTAEEELTSEAAMVAYTSIAQDESVPKEEKQAKLAAVISSMLNPKGTAAVKEVQKVAETNVPEPEITLTGKAEPAGPNAWRVRVDAQDVVDQGDMTGATVFVNGAEPTVDPVTGKTTFKVKASQVKPAKFAIAPDSVPDPLQPELPVQDPNFPKIPNDPYRQDVRQVLGDPEAGLYDQGTPFGDVFEGVNRISATEGVALVQMGVPETRIPRLVNTLPKSGESGNLVLDMFQGPIQEDISGRVVRLGNTDAGEWMNPVRFLKTTQIPADLMPAMRESYPEAFDAQGQVNPTALVKGLRERPMVEVKKLEGQRLAGREGARLQAQHELETRGYQLKEDGWYNREGVKIDDYTKAPEQDQELLAKAFGHYNLDDPHPDQGARYSFLGPKSKQDMPGYVEGLVRVPLHGQSIEHIDPESIRWNPRQGETREHAIRKLEGHYYSGPHFGSEDTNVLAFFRGYEETLPDGKKAFHVIEVQSDWGQRVRDEKSGEVLGGYDQNAPDGIDRTKTPSHPLLASYETLALKAAIDHARSVGAEAVILSDGETAMMTEGHDKQDLGFVVKWHDPKGGRIEEQRFPTREAADRIAQNLKVQGMSTEIVDQSQPSQSAGMRLHYDTTLPSAMKKLTGVEGERVEVGGRHKQVPESMSYSEGYQSKEQAEANLNKEGFTNPEVFQDQQGWWKVREAVGSPVFRNPDGTPKSNITGRLFSLDKITGGLSLDDTLSLKEAVMKYEQAKVREETARAKSVKVPESAAEWVELTAFHGSSELFDKPRPLRGDLPWVSFSRNVDVAEQYGQNIYEVKLKPKKLWDFEKPQDVNALIKAVEKDKTLNDIYGDEATDRDLTIKEDWDEWVQQVKEGNAEAIEVARAQIRAMGYDSFTTIEQVNQATSKAYHVFEEHIIELQKLRVQAELSRGATPTQAAETSRLLTQTPEVEAALRELEVITEQAQALSEKVEKAADPTKLTYKEAEIEGFKRLSEYEKAPLDDKKARGVLNALKEFTTTGADRKNISLILTREVGRWDGESVDGLRAMFHDALYTKEGAKKIDVASRGEGIPGVETGRVGMSEAEAQKTWESLSKDKQVLWEVTKGKPGEWKVQQKVTGGETTSLDAPVGESGTGDRYEKIDAKVAEATPQMRDMDAPAMEVGSVTLPRAAVDGMLSQMEALEKSPGTLNRRLRESGLTPEDWAKVKEAWIEDTYDGTEVSHMKAANILLPEIRKLAPYTLGSSIPFDENLVKEMRLREGLRPHMEWIAQQNDMGLSSQFAKVWLNFPDELNQGHQVLQGDPGWMPHASYQQGDMINRDSLPSQENRIEYARESVHETAHFMERKLEARNDASAIAYRKDRNEILQTLRVSKQLPAKVRALLERIIKNDDYNRYRNGENVFGEWRKALGNDLFKEYYAILYGLSDSQGYEMFANMTSDGKMQNFMFNEPVPKKVRGAFKSVLHWFSDIYNTLMHGPPEMSNALAELIASHDNYLTGGLLRNIYNGGDLIRQLLLNKYGVRPEAFASRMQTARITYTKGDLYGSIAGFEREGLNNLLPVTAVFGQIDQPLRTALVSGDTKSVFQGTMSLLPEQVPVHQELFYRMQQDVALAKEVVKNVKEGKIQADLPPNTEANLKLASVKLNAMRRALKKQGLALKRQADLANFTYDGLDSTIADQLLHPSLPDPESQPPEMEQAQGLMGMRRMNLPRELSATEKVRERVSEETLSGKPTLGWTEKVFAFTTFLEREHAEVRPITSKVREEHGNAVHNMLKLNQTFMSSVEPGNGELTVDLTVKKKLDRVANNVKLSKTFDDVVNIIAEKHKAGQKWAWTDPELVGALKKLSPDERDAVQVVQRQHRFKHMVLVEDIIPHEFSKINHENTGMVVAALEPGILPDQAREITAKIYGALQDMQDPARLPLGQFALNEASKQLAPQTFLAALKHANESIQDVNEFLAKAREFYDFVSFQRFDKHYLRMSHKQTGEPFSISAGTIPELQKHRLDQEKLGFKVDYIQERSSDSSPAAGVKSEVAKQFQDFDARIPQRLEAALAGRADSAELLARILPEIKRAEAETASQQAFHPAPGLSRNLVKGRELINMMQNSHEFYGRVINWFKHKNIRASTELDSMHPEIAGNQVLKDYTQQHVNQYLIPDNPLVRKFNSFVYYQRLALNLGNMFLEGVQSLGTGMQALIGETGSVRDAYKFTAKANAEYAHFLRTKKGSTPDIDWMLRKAEAIGALEPTLWDDTLDSNTNTLISTAGAPGQPIKKGLDTVLALARKPTSWAQKYNNNIAMLAGFKLGLEQGQTREEAFNFALGIKNRGTFTAGKPQRSVGLYNIKTRAVPQLMTSLTTYVQGWFNQMAHDYKVGFRGAGSDLSAQQRSGSRKAFVYGLAAQAVLAGGLGLPGVGQGIALLNQATGLDLKGWLRQNLAKLFDEDEDSGGLLTNLALRGAAQAVSPIDPSNRAAIAVPFVGVDPYKGFSVAALAGAPGSSVSDLVAGMMALAQGDGVGYQKMLPSVLKGLSQLLQGEGDVRDVRGGLLQTLSPAERWMTALGLPSSRIQRARDTADSLKKQAAQSQREKEKVVDEMARLARSGNTTEVQRRMLELRKQDPSLDLRSLAKSVANRVQAQTIPYDVRRDMNVGADIAGLQSRTPSTEFQRRQVSYDVEQSLGFQPSFNPQADAQAQAVDALLDSNPFLTRAEALRSVRGTRPARHRFDPAWMSAFQ